MSHPHASPHTQPSTCLSQEEIDFEEGSLKERLAVRSRSNSLSEPTELEPKLELAADAPRKPAARIYMPWAKRKQYEEVFDFSTQKPISPTCRTPLFPVSQNFIPFF